ncbi:MAG TPA: peptidylprolyl isomerase [Gemmatimonadaceae bacterium]
MTGLAGGLAAQPSDPRTAALDTIRRIEDLRRRGPSISPLLAGLRHRDEVVRLAAIRAVGRLESPRYAPQLVPLLEDSSEAIRVRGIEALARALRGWVGTPASALSSMDVALLDTVVGRLRERGVASASAAERAAAARALGLLPWWDARQARATESALMDIASAGGDSAREGVAYGLYFLARARRRVGDLEPSSIAWLRQQVSYATPGDRAEPTRLSSGRAARDQTLPRGSPGDRTLNAPATEVATRRLAWLALAAAGVGDADLVRDAIRDPDPQVRRFALTALPNVPDSTTRRAVLESARNDPAAMVRLEWMRVYRGARPDCAWLLDALGDPSPHVRLEAIDLLGRPCTDAPAIRGRLVQLAERGIAPSTPTMPPAASALDTIRAGAERANGWHAMAHALVALARTDTALARPLVQRHASHSVWQVRMAAATAAAETRDTATLIRLTKDSIGSVLERALVSLATVAAHAADSVYVAALASPDDHVVRAAARALRGATDRGVVLPALMRALGRLTEARRETSRDPRMELLERIAELTERVPGAERANVATRLQGYLTDFDPAVATRAAEVLDRLVPQAAPHRASPQQLPVDPAPAIEFRARPATHLRVTMAPASGGGTFLLRLHPDVAQAAVARIVWLARRGYYDGLTWHRVEPNFVIQGGSPGMNEYAGDGPFMRDELSLWSHWRGTVGISTRGRDTGDAQWFINLVDNIRLDPDYTIFATVEDGMDVVDGILQGDVMLRVEAIERR